MYKILGFICAMTIAQFALADSYWDHNGSVMRLVANGDERAFYYEVPSDRMSGTVYEGQLLFNGYKKGYKYYGTARVFSKYCDRPITYPVVGNVSANQTTVVLTGTRESYGKYCRPTGKVKHDRLVFTYLFSD